MINELYKQEFGSNFNLGIEVPRYFEDESYRHDTCPKFIYNYRNVELFLFVEHERLEQRETEDQRYTVEVFTYPDNVTVVLSTESPEEALSLIKNREKLNKIIESVKCYAVTKNKSGGFL